MTEPPSALPDDIQPFAGRFEGVHHYFALRVYYEDTDLSGIVYHANYLRYCERARSDMLRTSGIDQRAELEGDGGAYAVADLHIRYVRPAKLDDDLLVISTVDRIRAAGCHIHQRVMRRDKYGSVALLAEVSVVAAFIGPDGRPRRQPKPWIAAFQAVLNEKVS